METLMSAQTEPGVQRYLDRVLDGLAFVLPLSIALSGILWGTALLIWMNVLWKNRPGYRWTGLEIPYLACLGIAVLTSVTSAHPLHSLHALRRESVVAVFLLASQTGSGSTLRKRLVFFSLGAAVAAGFGLLQWGIGFNWDPTLGPAALPNALRHIPLGVVHLFALHAGRAQGFYGHPITYAEMLLLAGAVMFGFWRVEHRRGWIAGSIAVGGAILVSQTRSVWLALFLMLGAWAVVRRDKRVLAVALILAAGFGFALAVSPTLRGRAASIVDTKENESNLIRMGLWDKAVCLIRQHPVLGIGSGNFCVEGKDLRWGGAKPDSKWTETHNMYLQRAVGQGLVGFAAFLWFLGTIGRRLWKAAQANPSTWGIFFGFLGLLAAGVTESWTNDSEVVMCLYFLAGTAVAWEKVIESEKRERGRT